MICYKPKSPSLARRLLSKAFAAKPSTSAFKDPSIRLHDLPSPKLFSGELPDPLPRKTEVSNVISFRPKHPVVAALERNGGKAPSNEALAGMMDVSPGEASKRTREIPDMLNIRKIGKRVEISLKSA